MTLRWLKRVLLAALATLVLVALTLVARLWLSIPPVAGEARVRGILGPIEIVRDRYAIPHIYARSERDAYFGLGYVHAQDRLWQMEVSRRAGSGTLAAVLGERALDLDRLFRTLDLRGAAHKSLAHLDADTRGMLGAYSAGINAWLSSRAPLPIEFALLQHTPAAWSELDSLVVIKLMAWQLSGNFHNELRRLRLAAQLSPKKLAQLTQSPENEATALEPLFEVYQQLGIARPRMPASDLRGAPGESRGAKLDLPYLPQPELAVLASALARFAPAKLGRAIGSNNWAVNGAHSQSRQPLLANDPHLELSVPSQWYFAHLEAPGFKVIGASIPALPGVILGRNAQVAWSFTNMAPDTQDLYFEKLADDASYLTPAGRQSFASRRESIAVRGTVPVVHDVRVTRHGPVISDIDARAHRALPEGYVLALAWAGLAENDETIAFAVHAARAQNVAGLREAARHFHAPAQNIVFADRAGSIAFIGAGKIPLRAPENRLRGLLPAAGWLEAYDWSGYVPFAELPQLENPASGSIVTANQNTLPSGYPHWLGADFGPSYRADRIAALLAQRAPHTPLSFARLQHDQRSTLSTLLRGPMLHALGTPDPSSRELVDELRQWDGVMRAEGRAPLVFAAFLRELVQQLAGDELGEALRDEWEMSPEFIARVLREQDDHGAWCDDARTNPVEKCPEVTQSAWRAALAYLSARFGKDRERWRWGDAHRSLAAHRLFGSVPILGDLFNLSVARGGDGTSVDVGSYVWDDPELAFANDWGPSFRAVYDLADLDNSRGILNSGQSGHPLSKHYRDMLEPWSRGELVQLTTRAREVRKHAVGSLWLKPVVQESRAP